VKRKIGGLAKEFRAGNASTTARHDKALFFLGDKGAALNNLILLVCRALILF
jgi:hypothetical protein